MVSSVLPLRMMSGMGRKRKRPQGGRRRVSRRVGGRKMKMMIQGSGRRRTVARRRIRGYGLFDTLKNLGQKAFNIARSVPIVSTGLSLAGKDDWAKGAKALGFGRRRKRVGGARSTKRRFSVYGGRRMSVYGGRKRKTRRGGLFGSLMGAVPLALRALGGKRAVARRRRVRRSGGARKRTYPSGLLTLRRMLRR